MRRLGRQTYETNTTAVFTGVTLHVTVVTQITPTIVSTLEKLGL